jgi:hypothetical protein
MTFTKICIGKFRDRRPLLHVNVPQRWSYRSPVRAAESQVSIYKQGFPELTSGSGVNVALLESIGISSIVLLRAGVMTRLSSSETVHR